MVDARMEIMRRIATVIAVVLGIALTGFGETVTNVRGSQRTNSNIVDIYYDLNAVDGWSYTVDVTVEGRTNEVTATTFSGDVGKGIAPGKNRHIVWEAGADWRGKKGDVKAVVTATIEARKGNPKKVQLWEGGPYWADRNIGADNPWDYGLYFWWGDTLGHRPESGGGFGFYFGHDGTPTNGKLIPTLQSEGWITSDGVLALTHDAAHVHWGGRWRIPTYQELSDLCDKCDWTWTGMGVIGGYVVRGRGDYAYASIFLPFAGYGLGHNHNHGIMGEGHYWSSVPCLNNSWHLIFTPRNDGSDFRTDHTSRYCGFTIRPVQGFTNGSTADVATDDSAWFPVDAIDEALRISDVISKYFDGEYGGVGRKATFLNGVSCTIEMTILMDDYSKVDHWLVNGREVTTRTFTENVGSLAVGGRLEVVAVGKENGVRSKPFRANFDIARHIDEEHPGLWTANSSTSKGFDEIRYTLIGGGGKVSIPLAMEKNVAISDKWKWLLGDEWSICPKIEGKPEVRSGGNGSYTLLSVDGKAKYKSPIKFLRVFDTDIGGTIMGGPLTESWNPQKQKWVTESVSVGFSVEVNESIKRSPFTWWGPVRVFCKLKAELGVEGKIKVSGSGNGWDGLDSSFTLSSKRFPRVTVGPGVGWDGLACIKAPVSGSSVFSITYNDGNWSDFRWGLNWSATLGGQLFGFDATFLGYDSDTWWIINNTTPKSTRLMSSAPSADIEWRLQSRDYLKKKMPRMRLMAVTPTDGIVESGGCPDPAPAMASGVAGDALAYLRDNTERTSANRMELVLRTGTSNEWDAAEVVWDDGTADFMPEIAALSDGSFVATWANAGRTFSDDVTLPEMCDAMEIAVGVRNVTTGTWSCRNLTADSVLDFAPVVRAGTNGTALVAWLRNATRSLVGSAAEPTDVMASVYANGTWSAPAAVVTGAGSVSGFDVAFDGENAVLAFSKDADGDLETMGDMEIFAVRFNGSAWGEPVRLTYAGDLDGRPLVRGGAGTGFAVLWTEKGALMETTELAVSNAVAVAAADGWVLSGGCSVMRGVGGRDTLVWGGDSEADGAANAPVAMMYDPVCGAWGSPRKMLDDRRYERQLAGAVGADGGIRIGYESSSVSTNAEGEVIFGDVELRTRYIPATCDLAVVEDGFSFASENLADGDETVLTVKVGNLGFRTVTNATVAVYEGVGDEKRELGSVVTNFPGGGIVAVSVPWTVDNTQSNLQFTVEIDAGGSEDEGADGNNVYIWNAGAYDVSFAGVTVRNESATRRLITAAVSNAGLGPLQNGGKVVFRRGGESGEVLAVDEIGTVWPGTNGVYNAGFSWDMEGEACTSEWETVCVQLFPDGVVGATLDAADMAFVQVMTDYREQDAKFMCGDVLPLAGGQSSQALTEGQAAWLNSMKGYEAVKAKVATMGLADFNDAYLLNLDISQSEFGLGMFKVTGIEVTEDEVRVSVTLNRAGAIQVSRDGTSRDAPINGLLKLYGGESPSDRTLLNATVITDDSFSSGDTEVFTYPRSGSARFFCPAIISP